MYSESKCFQRYVRRSLFSIFIILLLFLDSNISSQQIEVDRDQLLALETRSLQEEKLNHFANVKSELVVLCSFNHIHCIGQIVQHTMSIVQ